MNKKVRLRLWLEIGLASITGFLSLITLVWRDWIERLFGVEPDGGNGTLEWAIVGGLLVATIVLFVLARLEWRKSQAPLVTFSNERDDVI